MDAAAVKVRRSRTWLALVVIACLVGGVVGIVCVRERRAPIVIFWPGDRPRAVALSAKGDRIALADAEHMDLFEADIESGAPADTIPGHGSVPLDCAFDAVNDTLVAFEPRALRRYRMDASSAHEVSAIERSGASFGVLAPGGGRLVSFHSRALPEVVDTTTGKVAVVLGNEPNEIQRDAYGWSPSGALVWRERPSIFIDTPPTVRVWSARDGRLVSSVKDLPPLVTVLDPGDACLTLSVGQPCVFLRELSTGRELRRFPIPVLDGPDELREVFRPTVSSDGELLALCARRIDVRAIHSGELVASFEPPSYVVGSCRLVAFDGAGDRLAGVWPKHVVVWKVPR